MNPASVLQWGSIILLAVCAGLLFYAFMVRPWRNMEKRFAEEDRQFKEVMVKLQAEMAEIEQEIAKIEENKRMFVIVEIL